MLALIGASLALQVTVGVQVSGSRGETVVRDSTAPADSVLGRRTPRRLPVTAEVLATAFHDAGARPLLTRTRESRLSQDSALLSYDATAYQRISVGLGVTRVGRERLLFRTENVSQVRWHRDFGVWVDVKGTRTALPAIPREGEREAQDDIADDSGDMAPIPYYPGYESLWIGSGFVRAQVDERSIVHPLAEGAEAYYTYASGDSVSFRLPDGHTIQLRELKVRPRKSEWNLAVGSLWFDAGSGQLVRAAYRLAIQVDVWAETGRDDARPRAQAPPFVRQLITPLTGQVSAIVVEYGLYQGRFWLPRIQAAEGNAQAGFMRVPFKMEQSFRYASVNALDELPPIIVAAAPLDSLTPDERAARRDSIRTARRAERDSIRDGLKVAVPTIAPCDTADHVVRMQYRRGDSRLPVATRVSCDREALANSPDLPASIFDPGEELFGAREREALISEALAMDAQPPMSLRRSMLERPRLTYGPELMRYNRVEGFSAGIRAEQLLGGGYTASFLGRLGGGDLRPNVELGLARSNLTFALRGAGYTRLAAANDWGSPLSFGSSVPALLFGRDEGFYYRAAGVELTGERERGSILQWRIFTEHHGVALEKASFSVFGNLSGSPNIVADEGLYLGSGVRVLRTFGLNPDGFRVLSDLRAEAASGDQTYARGMFDLTASHRLGPVSGALTVSGGSALGDLPSQRRWYLGDARTIRGQQADTAQSGNAFWLARAELGGGASFIRPAVFADLGWAGDRGRLHEMGRPMSGAGIGASFMDGLVRFDLSRGVHPRSQLRFDAYFEARF